MEEVLELLLDLNATDEQFESPTLFCSARQGICSYSPNESGVDLSPLFDTIVDYIPAPTGDRNAPLQMLVSSIDYNDYVGRIGIGRIERGTIRLNQEVAICDYHDPSHSAKGKIAALYEFDGLSKKPISEASAGEIVAFSGMADITIGRTLCAPEQVEPLPFVKISDPTIEMTFSVNDSPFAGREGKFVTSRNLRDRLNRELLKDVSLHVTEQGTDAFNVAGRGEMHLSILIETMRREGYEFQVSTPRVLTKTIDGKLCEPIERMVADVPEASMGSVIEKMGKRKGDLLAMTPVGSRYRLEFLVPSRGLFGYRSEFLTDTRGEGIMSSVLDSYAPVKGEIERRKTGSLIAFETGEACTYGLFNAQERGQLFIGPGTEVYAGMVVGVCSRNEDMTVNVCKKKQLTNMRAAGSDDALRLTSPRVIMWSSSRTSCSSRFSVKPAAFYHDSVSDPPQSGTRMTHSRRGAVSHCGFAARAFMGSRPFSFSTFRCGSVRRKCRNWPASRAARRTRSPNAPRAARRIPRSAPAQPKVDQIRNRERLDVPRTPQNAVDGHLKADDAEEIADELQIAFAGRDGLRRGRGVEEHRNDRPVKTARAPDRAPRRSRQPSNSPRDSPAARAPPLRADVLCRVGRHRVADRRHWHDAEALDPHCRREAREDLRAAEAVDHRLNEHHTD